MQLSWAAEHSDALREFLGKGMSYAEIAKAINARFQTAYSRTATIGRARRMGLAAPGSSETLPKPLRTSQQPLRGKRRESTLAWPMRPIPAFESTEMPMLRCVEIEPRHLLLMQLERDDCRYPYGGDEEGEAITFCGYPRRPSSSYCTPHFHLTRGPGTATERAAVTVALRLVRAA
jgi:GcrA cell cycle regulator